MSANGIAINKIKHIKYIKKKKKLNSDGPKRRQINGRYVQFVKGANACNICTLNNLLPECGGDHIDGVQLVIAIHFLQIV